MRRLEAQDLNIRKGHNLMNQLVVAGEYPINVVQYSHVTQRSIKAGAPVDWVGIDPIITGWQSLAALKNPPHPYTTMLFVDFMLSEEGQTLLRNRGFISSRENIEPDPPRLKKGLKLVPGDQSVMDDIQKYGGHSRFSRPTEKSKRKQLTIAGADYDRTRLDRRQGQTRRPEPPNGAYPYREIWQRMIKVMVWIGTELRFYLIAGPRESLTRYRFSLRVFAMVVS